MKKFKKIYIEITNICNLSCSFCPKHKRKAKYMTADEFRAAAEKLYLYGENFYLHLMGEPLSHPQLEDILDICSEKGMQTNITTNGTLLNRTGELLLQHNVRNVSISLHSFEANSSGVSMEKYLEDIAAFCKKAVGRKTIVELRLWTTSREGFADKNGTTYKILDFFAKQLEAEDNVFEKAQETFFSMENNRKKNFRLKENIFIGMAEQFSWPNIEESPHAVCEGFCYGLRNQIAVLSDGTVVPCCLDSEGNMPLGSIFESSLEEICQSKRSRDIYNGFTNRKAVEPLCQSCGYMKKYLAKK